MTKVTPTFIIGYSDLPEGWRVKYEGLTYEEGFELKRDAAIRVSFLYLDYEWQKDLFRWVQTQVPEFTKEDSLWVSFF